MVLADPKLGIYVYSTDPHFSKSGQASQISQLVEVCNKEYFCTMACGRLGMLCCTGG